MPLCGGNMANNLIDPKLREIHKSEVKSYFETWLSLQIPRRLKQLDESEVHVNAFMVDTWVANNRKPRRDERSGHFSKGTKEEWASDMLGQFQDDGMRKYVEEWEESNNTAEEHRTDLSNDIDVVNKYAAILGIDIVKEWWQKEGQKAYTEDLFSLMRK